LVLKCQYCIFYFVVFETAWLIIDSCTIQKYKILKIYLNIPNTKYWSNFTTDEKKSNSLLLLPIKISDIVKIKLIYSYKQQCPYVTFNYKESVLFSSRNHLLRLDAFDLNQLERVEYASDNITTTSCIAKGQAKVILISWKCLANTLTHTHAHTHICKHTHKHTHIHTYTHIHRVRESVSQWMREGISEWVSEWVEEKEKETETKRQKDRERDNTAQNGWYKKI